MEYRAKLEGLVCTAQMSPEFAAEFAGDVAALLAAIDVSAGFGRLNKFSDGVWSPAARRLSGKVVFRAGWDLFNPSEAGLKLLVGRVIYFCGRAHHLRRVSWWNGRGSLALADWNCDIDMLPLGSIRPA